MTNTSTRKLAQRVHRQYLLREAEHFGEHKKGIPEWLKNSDDSYIRFEESTQKDFSKIPIILNFSKKEICCLDFGGASSKDMIEHIPHYGSPEASTLGKSISAKKVSGGHGNGGKYYALSQFKDCRVISYHKGKLTILRLNKEGDFVDVEDKPASLNQAIKEIGLEEWEYSNELAPIINRVYNRKLGLFCWKGIDPKDKTTVSNKRNLINLLSSIANHPQARSALRSREVTALLNGKLIWQHLQPDQVESEDSFGVKEFSLPNEIEGYKFNTHSNSILKIVLSKRPLTGEKSSLNILEIDAFGRNIAYYDLPSLMLDKGISKSLAANIDCPELKEYNCVSNDRFHLIDSNEATRLFMGWCKSKIQEVLDELTNKEKKIQEKKDLEELGSFLHDLVNEVSDLLEEENIVKPVFSKEGIEKAEIDVPTEEQGYGGNGKIKQKGDGNRRGGLEKKEENIEKKKSKSKLKILLSNHDDDPLNPGKKYDMIERQPVLFQRIEDIEYGIWWINTQKPFIRKINIRDPAAMPFYLFLVKEIVFSHRTRRRFKEQERYDPDGLEEMNFDLIDEIFNKVVGRLGIELSIDESIAERIRNAIKETERFTVAEISEKTGATVAAVHGFILNPTNHILSTYEVKKEKIGGKGRSVNVYAKK